MTVDLVSLAIIALVAAACPIVAKLIPNKLVPETVFLLIAGALLGPNMTGAIVLTDAVGLLSDLGLAFLFLLAGYEINPKSLTGSQGKRGWQPGAYPSPWRSSSCISPAACFPTSSSRLPSPSR